jgi:hypothetical protein
MDSFIWHKVSEDEKNEIKEKAKVVLNKFSDKINNINTEEKHFSSSTNRDGFREEGEPWKTDDKFKDLTFLNAPFVEDDFITSEKASWVKN